MNSVLLAKKQNYDNHIFRRDDAKRLKSQFKDGLSRIESDLSDLDRLKKLAGSDPEAAQAAADVEEELISRRAQLQQRLEGAENGIEYHSRELKKYDMSDVEAAEERDGLVSQAASKIREIASYGRSLIHE